MAKIIYFPKRSKIVPFSKPLSSEGFHVSSELATDKSTKKIWQLNSKQFFNIICNKVKQSRNDDV